MTSFDPLHPKTGAIIELLAENQVLSTAELLKFLDEKRQIKMSTANFYKIIARMVENQILVKTGDQVALNMTWATSVYKYAEMMYQQKNSQMEAFLPFKQGERRTFQAESLDKIDPIWTHLVLYLFTQEKDEMIYVYEAHPWYLLGRPATERRMYESCYIQGKKIRMLLGNKTFLDQYGYQLHKTTPCEVMITDQPPFPKEGYTFWLCGEYIIECYYPELISQYFASFFETTKSINDFDLKTFNGIFYIKVPAELKVSRDKKKAEEMRQSIKKFFE